jgi:hypothetical protein
MLDYYLWLQYTNVAAHCVAARQTQKLLVAASRRVFALDAANPQGPLLGGLFDSRRLAMTDKVTHQHADPSSTQVPVVLFGVDQNGKPKAARFVEKHADLAAKAAGQLKLQVLRVTGSDIADLAGRLPTGRIHANGRGFVPYVRRDLYAKLVAAASAPAQSGQPSAQAAASGSGKVGSQQNGEGTLPKNWGEIGAGHVVIALDEPGEGWYEAIVVETVGDMLQCDGATTRGSAGSAVIGSA